MMHRSHIRSVTAATALWTVLVSTAAAQSPDPDPARFAEQVTAFERWDAKNSFPENAVVFVGSSSIRFWNTAEYFPGMPLINRGFGGSHISDVNHFVDETVLKYSPDVVVFYAGDNDTAAGKSSEQIAEDYAQFADAVLEHKPSTHILFLSIKPSLSRWSLWPQMVETNRLIRAYSAERANLHFVDVGTPMLGGDGEPMAELFVADGLHMTPAGYDVWTRVVRSALHQVR